MKHLAMLAIFTFVLSSVAHADITDLDDFSMGLTAQGALDKAALKYANVRRATADEVDDLFAAAAITISNATLPSIAWGTGENVLGEVVTDGRAAWDLIMQLGPVPHSHDWPTQGYINQHFWTDPEGADQNRDLTTRDYGAIVATKNWADPGNHVYYGEYHAYQYPHVDPALVVGWLLVSDAATAPAPGAANSSPTVTNVLASQRTDGSGIVDVYYTLTDADNDACEITVMFSDNGGSTWAITPSLGALSGDVGSSVTPGSKHLVWASKRDVPGTYYANYGVQITADDGIIERTVTVDSTTGGSTDQDGSHSVDDGDTITITPTANSGYHFTGWSGDASGSENPLIMTVTSHLDITANFAVNTPPMVDTEFNVHAQMQIDWQGTTAFYTGFNMTLWDDSLYAYNQGARSAIITGPGLPAAGQILEHYYPEPDFRLYPKGAWGHPSGGWGLWLDDTTILAIPDNAVYTIGIYQELASEVSLSDTPLQSYTNTIAKRPVLNSELDASLFPVLITPSSHDESVLDIPGLMEVSWTNPSNMEVDYMNLGLHKPDGTGYMVSTDVEPGDTSATLDASSLPSDVRANQLYMSGTDSYERQFGFGWELN